MQNQKDFFSLLENSTESFNASSTDFLLEDIFKNSPETNLPSPMFNVETSVMDHARPAPKDKPRKKRKISPVSLEKLLNPLKKEQLETVLLQLIEHHPEMEQSIRALLPTFDVSAAIQEAQKLKKRLFQAFPNTRYGSSYDHYSFGIVKSHQSAYITAVRKPINAMSSAKQWNELLEYILAIIEESAELPDWDCENDQKPKKALFKMFGSNLLKVLQQKEDQLTANEIEQITNLCTVHNTVAHGTPFTDCILFVNRK